MILEEYVKELQSLSEQYFKFENEIFELTITLNELEEKEKQFNIENKEPIIIEKSFELKSLQIEKSETLGKKKDLYHRQGIIADWFLEYLPVNKAVKIELTSGLQYSIKRVSNNSSGLEIENLNRMGLDA